MFASFNRGSELHRSKTRRRREQDDIRRLYDILVTIQAAEDVIVIDFNLVGD